MLELNSCNISILDLLRGLETISQLEGWGSLETHGIGLDAAPCLAGDDDSKRSSAKATTKLCRFHDMIDPRQMALQYNSSFDLPTFPTV